MRSNLVEFDNAPPMVQAIYSDFLQTAGALELPNWMKSLGQTPAIASSYWHLTKNTLFNGELPMILKELVIFMVSVTNGSQYCAAAHAHSILALESSMSFGDLIALAQDVENVELPASVKAALKFAVASVENPLSVSEEEWAELQALGYSQQEIGELVATISLAQVFNTYAMTYGFPIDGQYRAFDAGELPVRQ